MGGLGMNRLRGDDIAFLSLNPDRHHDLIGVLKDRADHLQINRALILRKRVDLILIEANFPYYSIFKFLKRLQLEQSTACVLMMGPDLNVTRVSALLRGGVFDYLKTPFSMKQLGKAIQKGLKNRENFLKVVNLSSDLEKANALLAKERDQLRKWNDDLSRLYELNQTLSKSLEIDHIVKSLGTDIKEVISYDISCLYLKGWDRVYVKADLDKCGPLVKQFKDKTLQDGRHFIKDNRTLSLEEACQDGSVIDVSLAVGTNRVGLLRLIRISRISKNGVYKKRPFSGYQEKILSMISAPLAIAIRNAEMYKQVGDLAVKDTLTNVLNRRAFNGILEREFRRVNRYNCPLALLVIDLDYFKKVNDTYGHLVGDQVLREIASTCQSSLRDIDVLVRYGGDEFVVILPGTNLQDGLIVANRIKNRVENALFYNESAPIRMTVSVGISHYPASNVLSPKDLFKRADQALYTAKKNGRNRIVVLKSVEEAEWDVLALEERGVV